MLPRIDNVVFEEIDAKMISLNWGIFLQGISRLKVNVSASSSSQYKLKGFDARVENITYSKNLPQSTGFTSYITTNILRNSGTAAARITLKGYSVYGDYTYTVVSYTKPQITEAIAKRVDSNNIEDENGTYLNITFKGTIDAIGNRNTNIFKVGYKEKGSANDYTYKVLVNDDKTTYTLNYENYRFTDITLDTTKNYEIIFEAIDEFRNANTTQDILVGFDLLNFNPSGKSMAIGKVSEASANEELLEIGINTIISKDLVVNGITNLKNILYGFLSSDVTLTAGSYTEIDTLSTYYNTTNGKLTISNGKIVVGSGVSLIKVSFNVGVDIASQDTVYSYITKNGTGTGLWLVKNVDIYDSFCREDLIDVAENDEISCSIYLANGGTVKSGARTNFIVEIIK